MEIEAAYSLRKFENKCNQLFIDGLIYFLDTLYAHSGQNL